MKSYVCKSCGAELLLNDEASFTTCLYCGNNIAVADKLLEKLNIKEMIPFSIDKEEAIKNYKKILRKEIISAKKVYIPVRFCNYDFDFLMYYEKITSDSDGDVSYSDDEILMDGTVKNDFIFNDSKVKTINFPEMLRDAEKVKFDPVLLNDVSIEYASLQSMDEVKKQLDKGVHDYSFKNIKNIHKVYSINYFTYNIDADSFSTLIPVYILKTSDGMIYNFPGIKIKNPRKTNIGGMILAVAPFIMMFLIVLIMTYSTVPKKSAAIGELGITFLIPAIVFLGIVVLANISKGVNINSKTYDNFKCVKYSFGSKRKKIK